MLIMAFGHRKYAGKDTAAKFVATWLRENYKFLSIVRVGFADSLKDFAFNLYGWAGLQPRIYYEQLPEAKDTFLPKIGKTVRQIWIEVGCKLREIYPDTWIDYLLESTTDNPNKVILIPDLRFHNEFIKIKQKGGLCINITSDRCGELDEADRPLLTLPEGYFWDAVIENNGSLKELNDTLCLYLSSVIPLLLRR